MNAAGDAPTSHPPATAAASALAGSIADPREYLVEAAA